MGGVFPKEENTIKRDQQLLLSPSNALRRALLSMQSISLPLLCLPSAQLPENNVRLACVKHIASVPSEPGSNSSFDYD